jgi:hypothetical protein
LWLTALGQKASRLTAVRISSQPALKIIWISRRQPRLKAMHENELERHASTRFGAIPEETEGKI